MPLTRQQKKTQQYNLISASRISNSVKNDKILDYLDLLDENGFGISSENLTIGRKRSRSKDYNSVNNYLDLLDENGLGISSENLTIGRKRSKSNNYNNINNYSENKLINKKKKSSFDYIVELLVK